MMGLELTGYIALIVLIVANVYYPARMIARTFFNDVSEVKAFFNKYLGLHMYLNFFGLSMLLTIFMAVAGFTMYQKAKKGLGRDDDLYHAKQMLFFAWFITVLVGHAIL
ncbi:putative magnetosome proetin Mad2 [Candidatus Magnetobacterium bavaricum]|uniref:Putative magnetosome proetin Mad2 n=2 Tax=Candidatus Magnetobacterium bavaricum TaxID=29290 RepID=A0A0F3GSK4_9BACT|nr:putative magnetosome proetin Mad2 [Candidatus Magnetobacterium bavaricum]